MVAPARAERPTIEEVREFWQQNPCGHETSHAEDRLEYFLGLERYRYSAAPWIREAAAFEQFRDRRVLEIGCGLGTDGAQFAKAGADYTGVDLTETAVSLARENFEVRGLHGELVVANAERLPFADASFDHVYSFGVKRDGTITVMLYNRTSVNYYLEIMVLRRLGRALLRPEFAPGVLAKLLKLSRAKLEGHRRQLLRIPHPTPEQWVSMNTDGPDCPLARVYSSREAKALFASFLDVRTDVYMFDRTHWPYLGSLMSDSVADAIGRRVGWNRMVYATKPC